MSNATILGSTIYTLQVCALLQLRALFLFRIPYKILTNYSCTLSDQIVRIYKVLYSQYKDLKLCIYT